MTTSLFAVDTEGSVDTAASAGSAGLLGFGVASFVAGVFASASSAASTLTVLSGFLSAVAVRCDPGVLVGLACAPVFLPVTLVVAAAVSSLSSDVASDADVADPVGVAEVVDLGPADVAEPECFGDAAWPEESDAPPVLVAPVDESDEFEEAGSAHATP